MSDRTARLVATVGGLGDRLPAPGSTVGSPAAVLLFLALAWVAPAYLLPVAVVVMLALLPASVWSAGVEAARRGSSDPGAIVVDEVAGQWLALTVLAASGGGTPSLERMLASLLLFRLFDIAKPWPIRRLERLPGGWGIVVDDLAAGALAAAVQIAVLRLA